MPMLVVICLLNILKNEDFGVYVVEWMTELLIQMAKRYTFYTFKSPSV